MAEAALLFFEQSYFLTSDSTKAGKNPQLVHKVFLNPFGRRSKLPLFCKPKLLQKPLVLELQLSELCLLRFIFRARNSHHFGSICGSFLLVFHEIMIAQNTLKIQRFQCFQAIILVSEHSQTCYRTMRLWLLDLQPFHEPAVFLRRQTTHLGFVPWPLVRTLLQAFVQQDKAVLFPVQALDAVSPPPAKQKHRVGERIQFKLLLNHSGQTVYALT